MEAAVKQVRTTRHPWLTAYDANTCPEDFKKSLWFQNRHMFIQAPGEGVSTCRSRGPNCELIERTYDCGIANHSLQGQTKNMEVVEDFESRPHKAATILAERDKQFQMWREQNMPRSTSRIQWWKTARTKQRGRRKRRRRGGRSTDGERADGCNPSRRAKGDRRSRGWRHSESCVCGPRHKGWEILSVNLSSGLGRWKEPRWA